MAYAVAQAHLCVINTSAVDHNLAHTGTYWQKVRGVVFFYPFNKGWQNKLNYFTFSLKHQ